MENRLLDILEPVMPSVTFLFRRHGARIYQELPEQELQEGDVLVIDKKWPRWKPFPHIGDNTDCVVLYSGTVVISRKSYLDHPALAQGEKILAPCTISEPKEDLDTENEGHPKASGRLGNVTAWSGHLRPDRHILPIARNAFRMKRIPLARNFSMRRHL